jgi:hypothetical protein
MNALTGAIYFLYTKCVRRYPSNFRFEFEEEMCDVFALALAEAKASGILSVLYVFYRELLDYPKTLLSEHWHNLIDALWGSVFRRLKENQSNSTSRLVRRRMMIDIDNNGSLNIPNKRLQILTALPLFLFGLGIAATSLTRGGPWYSVPAWRLIFSIVVGLLPMIVIAIVGFIALIRRLPDWGLTWVGSAFMGLVIFVKTLAEELAEVGQNIISEPVEIGLVIVLFLVGVALLVIVGMRGWQRGGLLSIGFSVTFALTFFWAVTAAPFYRHDIATWAAPFSLIIALITYFYTQASNPSRFMILLGVGLLNLGCLLTANTIWQDWFQAKGETSSPWPFVIFMFAFLICGPLMGIITRPIQQTLRRV